MQATRFTSLGILLFTACAAITPSANATDLTAAQKSSIGRKIWQNECAGTVPGLTTWNVGEEFPSLGIGHFIWYPAGFKGRFNETWPQFVAFAKKQDVTLPSVANEKHSPWNTKAEFQKDFDGAQLASLRKFLSENITVQTDFIIARSRAALPKMLAAAPASEKTRIEANYHKVATTPHGTYALIDYVNFKGEGTLTTERYNGRGWGLLQVLGEMRDVSSGSAAATEFAAAAKRVLSRRITNSPPARGEKRWEEGWHNRCATYARPL